MDELIRIQAAEILARVRAKKLARINPINSINQIQINPVQSESGDGFIDQMNKLNTLIERNQDDNYKPT